MLNKFFKRYCFEITRKTLVQLESVLEDALLEKSVVEEPVLKGDDKVLVANLMCVKTVIQLIEGLQKTKRW